MNATAATGARILVVDDETHLADGICENLNAEGYDARAAYDGESGLAAALENEFDVVLLDVMMPRIDGIEVCRRLRDAGRQTPVLFLSVKGTPAERVRGLEVGGDDYMAKPFHLDELLLRVAAMVRRRAWYDAGPADELRFGGNSVSFATYRATSWDGAEQNLTHKEAMILRMLSDHAGEVVAREAILDQVWGAEAFPSTRTIDNFILRLRKRFERNAEEPVHLHTVRGVGYRFTP